MKYIKTLSLLFASAAMLTACDDDDWKAGNPVMDVTGDLGQACFGDSLPFTIKASDADVALSTIHADLYFGDDKVSEKVIRTKENGADYSAKIYVPYYANIPDGEATLKLTLQNIHFTTTEIEYAVKITHPDWQYVTLVADTGEEYKMSKVERNKYAYTGKLPQEVKGKIITPAYGANGNEIVFGYEGSEIKVDGESSIPFSNSVPGRYTISFDSFTFEGSPFVVLSFNGQKFAPISDTEFAIDMNAAKGDIITPDGFPNFNDWWINPDFFIKNGDGTLSFNAYNGTYRFIADMKRQYFRVQKLNGSNPATLNEDGTGAMWIIGAGIGHPTLANEVGWTTENAICMAPIGEKTYRITGVGGKTIATNEINFKFFGQMGWGVELKGDMLTTKSNLIGVGTGSEADGGNGHDNGNLFLQDGVTLQDNGIYVITVDCTQGINDAVMTVELQGTQQFEEKPIYLNGQKMTTNDNSLYSIVIDMEPGKALDFNGFSDLESIYADPDYFTFDEDLYQFSFNPVAGHYNIVLNKADGLLSAAPVAADGSELTLNADGSGALYLMGWGVGSPDQSHQFGFTPGKAYSMAQVAPKVYQFTGVAGPENGSSIGDRYRADYLSFKMFHQNGWGGEFAPADFTMLDGAKALLKTGGNFELADGVNLEEGATYRMTVDLTAGTSAPVINFVKL